MLIRPEWIEIGDLLTLEEETYDNSNHWESWIVSKKDGEYIGLKQSEDTYTYKDKEIFFFLDCWWGGDMTYKVCLYKKTDESFFRDKKIDEICG